MGLFIVFEGGDGAGKSTQVKRLVKRIRRTGRTVSHLFEPTRGEFGLEIRRRAIHGPPMSPQEELDLFISDRQQNVRDNILPALLHDEIVVQDRYFYSSAAYQSYNPELGLSAEQIIEMHAWAPRPDLVVLLDVKAELGLERVTGRGEAVTAFENMKRQVHVCGTFRRIAQTAPRFVTINASRSEGDVAHDVWACARIFIPS